MSYLLDTHVLLWMLSDDPRLQGQARSAITDGRSRVLVSAVSAWEIAIKKATGKLRAPDDLPDQLKRQRFVPLDITVAHAVALGDLPDHHADPFDRMLVAQARTDRLTLITHDPKILRYDVEALAV